MIVSRSLKRELVGGDMSKPVGYHLIADINTDDESERLLLQDLSFMQSLIEQAAHSAGATCLNIQGHKFGEGQGVTAFAMLAESHISIHSWPENGFLALDIFMCGSSAQRIKTALAVFRGKFPAASIGEKFVEREYAGDGR